MHPDAFNPSRLALSRNGKATGPIAPSKRPPRHRAGRRFLKGPIPLAWLIPAARLPGKALAVAIVVWYLAGLQSRRELHWEPSKARSFGLNRHAVYRGLAAALVRIGFSVKRTRGRCPIVTILEVKGESTDER